MLAFRGTRLQSREAGCCRSGRASPDPRARRIRFAFVLLVLAGSIGLVVYVFVGYPAVMAAWAALRRRPVARDPAFTPDVSLIVAAYDEADVIDAKLLDVAALDYPAERLQVIVVADGSRDDTAERARGHAGVLVLHRPERMGKLAAVERAVLAATGDVLVLSDANNLYSPDALRELVAPLADPGVGLVAGAKVIEAGDGDSPDAAEGLYWRYESKLKEWESATGSVIGAPGEIMAIRREAYRSPPADTMNEDFVQAMRVALEGWRVVYAPRARSTERASATVADEAVRRSRLVTGRSQALRALMPELVRSQPGLAWRVVSHKGLRPAVPWLLVVAALANVATLRRHPRTRLLGLGQALFYGAAGVGWRDSRRGRRRKAFFLPYYFCRMNLATLRGLRDFAANRREHVWARVQRG
jgi:poly-beta-1,6-N-acetyl-D-glucosamine synthase